MGLTTEEILKLAEMSTSITNTVTDSQQNIKELESLNQFKQWELNATNQANEIEKNLVQEHSDELSEYNASATAIANSLNELELWGLTNDEIKKAFATGITTNTSGFETMAGSYTKLLKDNFTAEIQDASNRTQRIQNIKTAYAQNQSILGILDGIHDEIQQLEHHKVEAGKDLGIKGIFDAVDALDYISKNKNMFYTSTTYTDPNNPNDVITEEMPNYLHRAFTKTMKTDKTYGPIGMVDVTSENLKGHGINPVTMQTYENEASQDTLDAKNSQIAATIQQTTDAKEKIRKMNMDTKSAIVGQIQNEHAASEFTSMKQEFRIKHGLEDLSGDKIAANYLGKNLFYAPGLAEQELHNLVYNQVTQVDNAIRAFAENEGSWFLSSEFTDIKAGAKLPDGTPIVQLFDKNSGQFVGGHNNNPGIYWIGEQGKDGTLIKKSGFGTWYFDDNAFESIFADWDDNKNTQALRTFLEGHALRAKNMQDYATVDPFTLGLGNVNTSQMTQIITEYEKYKKGKLTLEELKARVTLHTNQKQQ